MTMGSAPMQYARTSDGVRIAYISVGDGPPLVFASNIFGEATGYCTDFLTRGKSRTGWSVSDRR